MGTSKKLRCFVAMAFGHEDTDYLYDHCIKPTIQNVSMIPIRVDKIVHNDRIDARIREEIRKADVLIADLTYARPSVYWEAGFAEREIPVIYICRKDHFVSKPSTQMLDLKVHFDLANANIIPWAGIGSNIFSDALRKRLMFVTINVRTFQKEQEKLIAIRNKFSQEFLSGKRDLISNTLKNSLLNLNYSLVNIGEFEVVPFTETSFLHGSPLQAEIRNGLFWKKTGSIGILVSAHNCYVTPDQRDFHVIQGYQILNSMNDYKPISIKLLPKSLRRKAAQIKKLRRIKIVPVLSSLTSNRIQNNLPNWNKHKIDGWYIFPSAKNAGGIPATREILFITNPKSSEEFLDKATELIKNIEQNEKLAFSK